MRASATQLNTGAKERRRLGARCHSPAPSSSSGDPRRSAWPGKNARPCLIADAATNPDNVLLLKGCEAGIARLPQSTVTYGLRNVTIESSLEFLQAPKLQPWPRLWGFDAARQA
jgi:hypothetical protein